MKTLRYLILAIIIFSAPSCKKYFDDVNVSDNLPQDVPIYALLPSVQVHLAYAQGGDAARYTAVYIQQIIGASRQFQSYNRYSFTESDFDNLWRLNLYGGPMQDLHILITKSAANGNINYQGVGEILMAYALGLTTDMWGDIPYSEAFQGDAILQPAFDSQQNIYASIQQLLSDGIAHVNASDDSPIKPGDKGEDLMFGGNAAAWTMFANGLKARHYMHLSKINAANIDSALVYLPSGLASNTDDAQVAFGELETTANPWYQYIEQRDDILYVTRDDSGNAVSPTLLANMFSKNDPRFGVYIDVNGDYWGTDYLGPFFSSINSPVFFFTYAEQEFLEAEAKLRTGDDAGALEALTEGIQASMDKMGVTSGDDSAYLATNINWAGTVDNKLELILYEKYVAMYLQPEAWTDWRRSKDASHPDGIPALVANPGNVTNNQIPRRFIYPNSERLYNRNCPQTSTLFSPGLWWDQ